MQRPNSPVKTPTIHRDTPPHKALHGRAHQRRPASSVFGVKRAARPGEGSHAENDHARRVDAPGPAEILRTNQEDAQPAKSENEPDHDARHRAGAARPQPIDEHHPQANRRDEQRRNPDGTLFGKADAAVPYANKRNPVMVVLRHSPSVGRLSFSTTISETQSDRSRDAASLPLTAAERIRPRSESRETSIPK